MAKSLHGVDLNLLVALEALLQERSVTRAAKRAGITQAAMSNTLKRLRHLFDDELLVRVGREFELTSHAASIQDSLERMLQIGRDEILNPSQFDPAHDAYHFTIATSNASAVTLLAPLGVYLAKNAPHVTLRIAPVEDPLDALLARPDIDILLLPDHFGLAFPTRRLLSQHWVCIVDADHPFTGGVFTESAFMAYPHIVYEEAAVTTNAQDALEAHGLVPRTTITVNDFVTIPYFVQKTNFVAVLQATLANAVVAPMGLRLVEPPIRLPQLNINAYWHPRNEKDAANTWLRGALTAAASNLNGGAHSQR